MLKRLQYNLKFSSTGRKFSGDINFKPGLTVVTGDNEAGKSLILEMIEYAWFGVGALRGKLSDYEVINVDLEWESKGETYTVSRHGNAQNLNKTKAVGAQAVNKAVIEILGVTLDVFRIACSAKQGELDKLTARMQPTERRKMVDSVIGLNTLEAVEKLCREKSNSDKRLRDELEKRIPKLEEPEQPEGYEPSETLDKVYKYQLGIQAQRTQLSSVRKPVLPAEPTRGEFTDDVEQHEQQRKNILSERTAIERTLRTIPSTTFSRSDTIQAEQYYEQEARGPRSTYSQTTLEGWLADWEEIKRLAKSVECPNCHTKFVPGEGHVKDVVEPKLTVSEIRQELRYIENWEGHTYTDIPVPALRKNQIEDAKEALAKADIRDGLEKELDKLVVPEDRSKELDAKHQWELDSQRHSIALNAYMNDLVAWDEAQKAVGSLPEFDPSIEEKLTQARIYEEHSRRYAISILEAATAQAEVDALSDSVKAFSNGAEALKYIRSQVKQHLVPSLNRVASHLLSEMTNGQRTEVVVDEDFEVTVDGQPVRTLSGSGVSVVNLSLRVALGQVLTQKVIPIFLADEIDHDMAETRAVATHEALRKMTNTLDQIIVVSHKKIDGDHHIEV